MGEILGKEDVDVQPTVDENGEITIDWSSQEERRLVLKLDVYLMPLVLLAFFFLCLDRSNISNALTDHFTTDLGITTKEASLGNQLQLAGIVIFELPANVLLPVVGPQRWLIFQMFAWSSVATLQCLIRNKAQYFATRFLLGMFEGGFIPGAMYLIAQFYQRREVSTRYAIYYYGNYLASGTSSLIAAGILTMDGVRGWSGWRWLFLVDGAMTFAYTLIVICLLPGNPQDTRPVHGLFDLFNERERHILTTRMSMDRPQLSQTGKASLQVWLKALIQPRLWMHFLINLVGMVPAGGFQLFAPTIVKGLGFSTSKANALVSVGYYAAIILSFGLGFFASRPGKNGIACIIPFAWSCFFAGLLYHFNMDSDGKWTLYALFMLVLAGMLIAQPINNAWCSKNSQSELERSVGLALCTVGSNLGGLIGQQMFQSKDAPEYRSGFIAAICLYCAVIVIVVLQIVHYGWLNSRGRHGGNVEGQRARNAGRWRFVL